MASGKLMRTMAWIRLAPSIRAQSSISRGMVLKYPIKSQVDGDVNPGQLPELSREPLELDVGGRNEAPPFQDVELRPLREAGGLLRGDHRRDPAADSDPGRDA